MLCAQMAIDTLEKHSLTCRNCGLPIKKIIDPWGYDNYRGQFYGYYHPTVEREANVDGADVQIYATFCPGDLGEAEPSKANSTTGRYARLIAAAPDLLDACRKALSCLAPEDNDMLAQSLRAAIAKAERRHGQR